jgi:hypothetical protein
MQTFIELVKQAIPEERESFAAGAGDSRTLLELANVKLNCKYLIRPI